MHQIFAISHLFEVRDGTLLSPFLNPQDSKSGLPFDLLHGFSIAAGVVKPGTNSKIHIMPFVTQVTFVRRGQLSIRMKNPHDKAPYTLTLQADQAILTEPGTLLQLINEGDEACELLYIVSPPYLYETLNGKPVFDDSIVVEQDWHELESDGWQLRSPLPTMDQRQASAQRMAETSKRAD